MNAIWHVESKKTLGTRLILMSSLSTFVKFKKKQKHDAASYRCAFSDWRDFGCYPRGALPSVLCVKPEHSHGPFRDTPWNCLQSRFPFSKHLSRLGTRQIMMHPAVDSDLQAEGGGGGRTLQNFVRGGSDPSSNHLLSNAFINMSFLQKKYSFRIPFTYYLQFKI